MITFFRRFAVPLIFIWVLICGLTLSWKMSMTTDEGIHVASGYLAITRGDHRFDPEHPFLFKYVTALPLVAMGTNLPPDDAALWNAAKPSLYDSWKESREWTDQWFYKSGNNAQLMIFLARLGGVAALLGLCWVTLKLGTLWFGERVGKIALFFAAFNPTLLAHGSTANTDIPVALAGLLALWSLWLYGEKPSLKQAGWVGLALGGAILTKYSALYFLPVALIWLVYVAIRKRTPALAAIGHFAASIVVILAFLQVVYFFRSPVDLSAAAENSHIAICANNMGLNKLGYDFETVSKVIPSAFNKGFVMTACGSYYGRATFIIGRHLGEGVWYYFPTLFLLKTQLVALVLGIAGLWFASRTNPRKWQQATWLMALTLAVVGFASLQSKLNLGIRHITPALSLFSLAAAASYVAVRRKIQWKYLGVSVALLYMAPVFFQLNNLIGFSNALIWNKADSYKYFNDSNLDWGQQAKHIASFMKDHHSNAGVKTNYGWNPYALSYFGVRHQGFDPKGPLNGYYIVTATQLASDDYRRFRETEPTSIIDTATFFYSFDDKADLVN